MMKVLTSAVAVGVLAMGASAGGTVLETFNLFNHPSGAVNPQEYGLRLDNFGGASPVTFSFEDGAGNSDVQLQVIDAGMGVTQIHITGVLRGNSATGGTDYGTFMLDVLYTVNAVTGGWDDGVTVDGGFIGDLTALAPTMDSPLLAGESQDLFTITDGSGTFRFLEDGHRISGDSDTWVGRGWLSPDGNRGFTNDFLFTAQVVPLPPAAIAGFAMLAGVGAYRRLRK
jgi:hypothetical protein